MCRVTVRVDRSDAVDVVFRVIARSRFDRASIGRVRAEGASGALPARPPSITAHRVNPSCTATAAAWLALWPCVLTNTMLDRFVGGSNPVRSSQCVCRLRSARACSPAGTRAIRSLPLNSRSGASSSELSRTSTSTGRTLLLSTSSQNADGERRAYAPRPARMLGRLPSPRAPPLFSRDFCSASFCARSTRIDHAMRERHTAVVRGPADVGDVHGDDAGARARAR